MNIDNYKYCTEKVNSYEWINTINEFEDSNLYQTETFNLYSTGGNRLEIFKLFEDETLVSASIVRLKLVPILNKGVAYIRWGPMWNRNGVKVNIDHLFNALKYLYKEYVIKRKLVLRIMSNLISDNSVNYEILFDKNSFKKFLPDSETIIIDLNYSEDDLRANLRKKWRYSLKQSEKKNLRITMSKDENDFQKFISIYNEMHMRKKFDEYVNVETFAKINKTLNNYHKMNVFLCYHENDLLSGAIISNIGNTGIYLLGGSTKKGLEYSSSYFLHWEIIKWLRSNRKRYYDLGGIDKISNPGVYTFKSGLGGQEVKYTGAYEASNSIISSLIIKSAEKLIKKV